MLKLIKKSSIQKCKVHVHAVVTQPLSVRFNKQLSNLLMSLRLGNC